MVPVSFGRCAAWLHDAQGGRGAVLLPAYGFEELCGRHALRCLAERLAGEGISTLRLDYRGTGDSGDIPDGSDPWAAWTADAHAAIDVLRGATGVEEVALVGLRLGALIAPAVAAARPEVTRLALLAPPASGAGYLRETRALALMRGSAPGAGTANTLDAMLAERLMEVDVATLRSPPAGDVLILSPDKARGIDRIADRFASLGATVSRRVFHGYQEMMCDPTAAQVPEGALEEVASWILADAPISRATRPSTRPAAQIEHVEWIERGVVIGEGDAAGVSCMPTSPDAARPAVLFLNAGGIHHAGWERMHVAMARRLAGHGIASLRLDFPGVGDAAAWPGPRRMNFYDEGTLAHVAAALDWLQLEGAASMVIAGTCSGAHHAFHAAVADPRVAGLVMLNTLCFVWSPSYALPLHAWKLSRPKEMASRQRAAGEGEGATLVERVIDTSLPVLKGTVRGLMEALKTGLAPLARSGGGARNQVEAWFATLSAREVRIALVYGEDDPGRTELERHMGPDGGRATALPGVSMHLIADTDHALSPEAARARYSDIVLDLCLDLETGCRSVPSSGAALRSALG